MKNQNLGKFFMILIFLFLGGCSTETKKINYDELIPVITEKANTAAAEVRTDTAADQAKQKYFKGLEKIIQGKAKYRHSQESAQTGVVRIKFTIQNDGSIKDIFVIDKASIKSNPLRLAAVRTVREISPYQPFPKDMKEQELTFEVNIIFSK